MCYFQLRSIRLQHFQHEIVSFLALWVFSSEKCRRFSCGMNKSPKTENICLVSGNSNMNPVKKLFLSVNPAELLTFEVFSIYFLCTVNGATCREKCQVLKPIEHLKFVFLWFCCWLVGFFNCLLFCLLLV